MPTVEMNLLLKALSVYWYSKLVLPTPESPENQHNKVNTTHAVELMLWHGIFTREGDCHLCLTEWEGLGE